MRARLALAVSGVPYALREITLRHKPPQLLAASPKGTVPVLVLPNGDVIDESLDIMRWALGRNDPECWLARGDELLAVTRVNDTVFKHHLDRYKYPDRYTHESSCDKYELAERHRAAGSMWLAQLEAQLASPPGNLWLFGQQPSLADMASLPFIRQFAHTNAQWFAAQPWPALQGWLARFESSSLFTRIMAKQPVWNCAV